MAKDMECPKCGTRGFYTLKDMIRVCKKCGHRWKDVNNCE